jgi:hypothetical protein
MLKIPKTVAREAAMGNKMIANGYQGGTQTGWNRGEQLANDKTISVENLKVIRAWFARHVYTSRPGYLKWKKDGSPTNMIPGMKSKYRGAVAYLIWGGQSAYDWIQSAAVQKAISKSG